VENKSGGSVFALADTLGLHLVKSIFSRSAPLIQQLKKDNTYWVPTFRRR